MIEVQGLGKTVASRHFPYQHPVFGTKSKPAHTAKWKGTVYYWWWMYLRCNALYLQTCAAGGSGPCADIYRDFGDVRTDDFRAWWSVEARGVRLFAEPRTEDVVRVLLAGQAIPDPAEALTISFPLNFPKRELEKRFRELLAKHHAGKQGVQYAKRSNARYKVQGQPNVPALALGFEVWQLRRSRPDLPLWEIGNRTPGVLRTQKIKPGETHADTEGKRRALAATVSRYVKRVDASIERAGRGIFP